jgi:hypothetical protein
MKDLGFEELRKANVERCEQVFHKLDEWSPTDWATAVAGEVGEACNVIKKLRRLDGADQTLDSPKTRLLLRHMAVIELADVVIYADLLAARLGMSLGDAVRSKFNEVSVKRGASVFLKSPEKSNPMRVACDRHNEFRPVYTTGRPLLDDRCPWCRIEELEASLRSHFQREHLDGDGREIDRFRAALDAEKERAEKAEAHMQLRAEAAESEVTRLRALADGYYGEAADGWGKFQDAKRRIEELRAEAQHKSEGLALFISRADKAEAEVTRLNRENAELTREAAKWHSRAGELNVEVTRLREVLVKVLAHCDYKPEGETLFERAVIRAREALARAAGGKE